MMGDFSVVVCKNNGPDHSFEVAEEPVIYSEGLQ